MKQQKVLIVGGDENPSLPIAKSLASKGIEVHVACHKSVCVGFFSRYVSKRIRCPSPLKDEQAFVERILDYVRKEAIDVTIPLGEQPTYLLSTHKESLSQHTKLPLVDIQRYMKCRDKTLTMKTAARIGIPIPKTYYPAEVGIDEVARSVTYPAVIKPNSSDGARGISYPTSPKEMIRLYSESVSEFGPCHVQEYIPHTGRQYKAELMLDDSSEVKAWCVYHKIRYYPPSGGSSTLNSTVSRPDILELAARMLRELRWYGMGDCDFIEDPRDRVPKLMEINPRFTRSIKICLLAGVDFPHLLFRMALGERVPSVLNYKVGTMLRYLPSDVMWFLRSKNRFRSEPAFFPLLSRSLKDEVISLEDPGPALAYFLSMTAAMLSRRERKARLRLA